MPSSRIHQTVEDIHQGDITISRMPSNIAADKDPTCLRLGYLDKDIPNEYLLRIINLRPILYCDSQKVPPCIIVSAPLQEEIRFQVNGAWTTTAAMDFITGKAQQVMQVFTGRTLINQKATRRYWTGTSPIKFNLNLTFQARNNATTEVMLPMQELQRMSLPYSAPTNYDFGGYLSDENKEWLNSFFGHTFLGPPGPNPFLIEELKEYAGKNETVNNALSKLGMFKENETISIKMGEFIELPSVIMTEVNVSFPPAFQKGGTPISGKVSMTFETYEIVTKESLDDIYPLGMATVRERSNIDDDTVSVDMQIRRDIASEWLDEDYLLNPPTPPSLIEVPGIPTPPAGGAFS